MRLYTTYLSALVIQALLIAAAVGAVLLVGLNLGVDRLLAAGAPDAAARLFARDQTVLILVAIGGLFIALGVGAAILARRWSRPQIALARESRIVAQGQYDCGFVEDGAQETRVAMRNLGRIARSFDRLETARRTWLVSVSEELRRPIHRLAEDIEALLQRRQIPEPAEIDAIGARVRRLGELAEDLHAVALADLGRLPVAFAQVDPTALIHNALWLCRRRADEAHVSLETGPLPPTALVKWDGVRIEQLFTALIENSLRYVPAGGRIVLGLEQQRGAWRLIVDDTAPGVDVDMAQKLFEPFYRTASDPGTSVTTSGLGLATAQAIVEAHHGRIEAGHSPLGGLRVVTTLPTVPPTA
ncbi:MAG: ATP-binding protein [Pseudomonadota bacterium]